MEIRAQQIFYGVAEVIATHNLLRFVQKNTDEERMRMVAGAGLVSLGYFFGPELQERLKLLNDRGLDEKMQQQLVYAAGGVLLGGFAGYTLGPKLQSRTFELAVQSPHIAQPAKRPDGLITIASAGWLAYSLFFDGKTPEEQRRHMWALGAGAVGYMYGPEMLRKTRDLFLPAGADKSVERYARGAAMLGATAGGVIGWYKGRELSQKLLPE
jgi:hypothetical protein